MKSLVFVFISLFSLSAFAESAQQVAQRFSDTRVLTCTKRLDDGRLVESGTLRLEHWQNKVESQWACRRADGTFIYGATGELEKFRVQKGENERTRLVFRDGDGQFVTWMDFDQMLSAQWESYGRGNSRYVIRIRKGLRTGGQIVNFAYGHVENWRDGRKVCAVRETADGVGNGKLLTWVVSDQSGVFHDPVTGRYISCRNPR